MSSLTNNHAKSSDAIWGIAILALAMVFLVIPVPEVLSPLRPDFVALALLYLCWYRWKRVGVLTAFVVGLLVDVLTFGVLGQHALAKVILVYLAIRLKRVSSEASIVSQALLVLALLFCQSVVIILVKLFTQDGGSSLVLWISSFVSALIWLLIATVAALISPLRNVAVKKL